MKKKNVKTTEKNTCAWHSMHSLYKIQFEVEITYENSYLGFVASKLMNHDVFLSLDWTQCL